MKKRGTKNWFKYHREHEESCHCNNRAGGCGVYFVGFIGAAIYYIQQAPNFWAGVLGILKAMVWPAFLVYKLLGF